MSDSSGVPECYREKFKSRDELWRALGFCGAASPAREIAWREPRLGLWEGDMTRREQIEEEVGLAVRGLADGWPALIPWVADAVWRAEEAIDHAAAYAVRIKALEARIEELEQAAPGGAWLSPTGWRWKDIGPFPTEAALREGIRKRFEGVRDLLDRAQGEQ